MAKLQCKVSHELNAVIKRAHTRCNAKGRALRRLVKLALADDVDRSAFKTIMPFATDQQVSCTLTMTSKDYEATQPYRERYELVTKNMFFAFALQHGAILYNEIYPPVAPHQP